MSELAGHDQVESEPKKPDSKWLVNLFLAVGSTLLSLVLLDLILIAFNVFPPVNNYGDPDVGWRSAIATGSMVDDGCAELESGRLVRIRRNEDGVRSEHSASALRAEGTLGIAVSGDSHTDLCAPNGQVHFGVMERELRARGVPAFVYANGAGKYSPLQAYLAVRPLLRDYRTRVFVLNLYTGNDFMDLLRIDDRPHLVPQGDDYQIAPPVWYQQDPPGKVRRSRVLGLVRRLGDVTGVSRIAVRVAYLRDAAAEQGKGTADVIGYMNELRLTNAPGVGYPQAFTAQMLNQQLFFARFTGSREESLRRLRYLLTFIRREHPELILVLSPIPSFQLVHTTSVDSALDAVLDRLPLTYMGGVKEEEGLFEASRTIAKEAGWLFVDNLAPLRARVGIDRLYNTFDYHIEPVASVLIGTNQADALTSLLRTHEPTEAP
jgi:hypothetical protein